MADLTFAVASSQTRRTTTPREFGCIGIGRNEDVGERSFPARAATAKVVTATTSRESQRAVQVPRKTFCRT
jgi:hypothetical protein